MEAIFRRLSEMLRKYFRSVYIISSDIKNYPKHCYG